MPSTENNWVTRRQALQGGALAFGALALEADPAAARRRRDKTRLLAGRSEVSFDEGWLFLRGDPAGVQAPSFDDTSWRKLDLPHDWRIEDLPYATSDDGGATGDPSAFAFETDPAVVASAPRPIGPFDPDADPKPNTPLGGERGQGFTVSAVGWYRKHFAVPGLARDESETEPDGDEQRIELRFDGVYQNADFWLNGNHLGFHPNGYTSFAFDLTRYVNRRGNNVLAVRVNCTGETSRWYSGSGIYRHTWLTVTSPVRIPLWGVYVTTPSVSRQQASVHAEVAVENKRAARTACHVLVTILDSRGRAVVKRRSAATALAPGEARTFKLDAVVRRPALWSPDAPTLYRVRAEVIVDGTVVDSTTTPFGLRSLAWNGKQGFLLNGKPIKFLGACIHHDHGALGAVALDRSEERKIEILKAAGFNAIRASHNPRSPAMLDACDRLGMLVWDEFSDMWDQSKTPDDYSKYFPQYWQQDLGSMVLRDRNHPSVVIWSLGNEVSDSNNYGPRLAALVRSLDRTRPITVGGTLNSSVWEYVDIGDVHYAVGVTDTGSADYSSQHAGHEDKPMSQSEDFIASFYDDWKFAQDTPWAIGNWIWAGWDYIGEAGTGAPAFAPPDQQDAATAYSLGGVAGALPYPWYMAFCGDIDLIGQRKPQNYWRQVVYGLSPIEMAVERPPPPGTEQYPATWSYYDELQSWTWNVLPTQSMTVRVYTSGDRVDLILNGQKLATNALTEADKRTTTFSVTYAPGALTAIAYKDGSEIGRRTFVTTGAPAALRLTSDVPSLTTGREELAHVLLEVVDSQGRRVPDAVEKVDFSLEGAGTLAGVANGNPINVDSFKRPRRWTWHGQALAILRPAKTAGTLTLTASAQGLQPATLRLPVAAPKVAHPRHHNKLHHHPTDHKKRRHPAFTASLGSGSALVLAMSAALLRRRMQHAGSRSTDPAEPLGTS